MKLINRRSATFGLFGLGIGGARALAQAPGRAPKIGYVTVSQAASFAPNLEAFRAGLADQGLPEGRGITIEYRYGDDKLEAVPDLVRGLLSEGVDLIVGQGAAAFEIVKSDLPVPLVYIISADPISADFADSLSQPRGNKTGLTLMAFEFAAKRLELLQEMVPGLKSVAVIGNPEHPGANLERAYSEETGRRLGLSIDYKPTPDKSSLDAAFVALEKTNPQAISLLADGFAIQYRQVILDFATSQRLPVISGWPVFARTGALCTYGPRQSESYRRLGYFVSRILKGARAADLPVERPTKFELVLNLKTARTLGLTLPRSMLARADEVIE
jgi:putative ABC transport system substrate-binding protein